MRRAIWMALAFVGTTPLVAVAQIQAAPGTQTQQQLPPQTTAASPTGAATLVPAQPTLLPGFFFGVPVEPPLAPPAPQGNYMFGTGGSGASDITYRGSSETPSATPPVNTGTGTGGTAMGTGGSMGTGGTAMGTGGSGGTAMGTASQGSAVGQIPVQNELYDLRQRVGALERELGALRGTGGAGTGVAQPVGTQPANAQAGTQPANAESGTEVDGSTVLATAEFDGRVQGVTSKHIDIVDSTDGTVSRLLIDEDTKVTRGNKRVKATRLSEGTPVRASFAFTREGEERALTIEALPRKQAPRK